MGDATRSGLVSFQGAAQAVSGTGEIVLAAATGSANLTNATGGILTFGPGITVRGRSGTFSNGGAASAVVNRGAVRAEVAGATITINGGTFGNEGTLRAVGGGRLTVAGLAGNVGDVAVTDAGSSLRLEGTGHVLDRDVTVPAGTTLELGGTWSNRAAIHVAGGALSLQGNFATADLGTIDRPGGAGTVTIAGLLRNAGATLALNAATGPWSLAS